MSFCSFLSLAISVTVKFWRDTLVSICPQFVPFQKKRHILSQLFPCLLIYRALCLITLGADLLIKSPPPPFFFLQILYFFIAWLPPLFCHPCWCFSSYTIIPSFMSFPASATPLTCLPHHPSLAPYPLTLYSLLQLPFSFVLYSLLSPSVKLLCTLHSDLFAFSTRISSFHLTPPSPLFSSGPPLFSLTALPLLRVSAWYTTCTASLSPIHPSFTLYLAAVHTATITGRQPPIWHCPLV